MAKIYTDSAEILKLADEKRVSYKTAFYEYMNKSSNSSISYWKQVMALVCKLSSHRNLFRKIADNSKLAKQKTKGFYIVQLMLYDMLIGKGIKGSGKLAKQLAQKKTCLEKTYQEKLGKINLSKRHKSNVLINYVRVNVTRIKADEAYNQIVSCYSADPSATISTDNDIPYLIVLKNCSLSPLMTLDSYKNGSIVVHDRSSCANAILAKIKPGMTILDICAAPGSKALHCLDLMNQTGKYIAVEKDLRRALVLIKRIKLCFPKLQGPFYCNNCSKAVDTNKILNYCSFKSEALSVEIYIKDVFVLPENISCSYCAKSLNLPEKYDVVLIDPSCSGIGLSNREQVDIQEHRFLKLRGIQQRMIDTVLKNFGKSNLYCYSTCSTNIQENEHVILDTMQLHPIQIRSSLSNQFKQSKHNLSDYLKNADLNFIPELKLIYRLCFHSDSKYEQTRGYFFVKFVLKST